MSKALLVAQRELLDNIRTKGFWIGIIAFPVILTLIFIGPIMLDKSREARIFTVVDRSGWLLPAVERNIKIRDLTRVFGEVVQRYRTGGEEAGNIPAVFLELAPLLAELDAALIPAAAALAVTGDETEKPILPEALTRSLEFRRDTLLAWWDRISPEEAGNFSAGISRCRFLLVKTEDAGQDLRILNRRLERGELFAYFVIGKNPVEGSEGSLYVSKNLTDRELRSWFEGEVTRQVRNRRLALKEIDPGVGEWLMRRFTFESQKVGASGKVEKVKLTDTIRQWVPVAFVYLLWISVFGISQALLSNTVEEKSSRVMEVLLSSISPLQLMAGKIAGIAATGLILVGCWMVTFVVGFKLVPNFLGIPPGVDLSELAGDPFYIGSFMVYFLLGYLFYSAFLVAIGSVCSTHKEAQNMMGPLMLVLILPIVVMVPIAKDPNGTLAIVLSYIPFFTPFVMMNRAATMPPPFEYVTTTLLMLMSILAALWIAAKIFRIGVLLTGKPPKLGEMLKWIKAPVGTDRVNKPDKV